MSVLGQVNKQPDEVDVYAIDLTDDMMGSDAPATAFAFVLVKGFFGPLVPVTGNTTITTNLSRYLLSAGVTLTLSGMAIGDRVCVANVSAVSAATVGSTSLIDGAATISLPAGHGRLLVKTATGWVTEADVRVIVDTVNRHVRNWMTGGYDKVTYRIEATTTTNTGRTLQDEIIVKVRDE